jgi:N-acetylglucosamine-6-phosphate deacetylase
VLGAHLEGPFINPVKKGAHAEHLIRDLSGGAAALEECYGSELDGVAIVTLAPELKGADDATRALKEKGIVISVGHTACDLAHAEHAIEKGASCITHLFNAMTAFHHRCVS